MSDISVLGLGSMGAALARAFQTANHRITVWNRTPEKMQAFVTNGAVAASSVESAVGDSPATVICVDDYTVTRRILDTAGVIDRLSGRTVIQLTTGTPQEAREFEAWLQGRGVDYIDGAIMGGPSDVDAGNAQVLLTGSGVAYGRCEQMLQCLGSDVRYLGENIGAAATLDLAWLSQRYGLFLGVAHGARLCESENVDLDLYAAMFPEGDRAHNMARVIYADDYENPGATLSVWAGALKRVLSQAHDAGINCEIPDFVTDLFERAIAAGHGEEDVAALVKVLRGERAKRLTIS
ncbi:MAG: NAD(P)-binding domain-containing protein [Gammaproteobacteria bacterium]|nr:NAD(P)-binding domain-containing protein [Gammaproteobacteria bacterium]